MWEPQILCSMILRFVTFIVGEVLIMVTDSQDSPLPPIHLLVSKSVIFKIIFTFIHMCIHCLGHLPPAPTPSFQAEPVVVLWFCWRENIRDNKKDIAFLLVCDKDSYAEIFLALLPCTCALQPILVHLYQTSSLFPGPPPTEASASLRLLYSLLYSVHINHIQVLGFLPFSYSSHTHSLLPVWPMSSDITAFILRL
jgi:hypothetical protein